MILIDVNIYSNKTKLKETDDINEVINKLCLSDKFKSTVDFKESYGAAVLQSNSFVTFFYTAKYLVNYDVLKEICVACKCRVELFQDLYDGSKPTCIVVDYKNGDVKLEEIY